ncbi:MAG: hypothetical protein ABI203_10260 [Mucilaginibacter sp.]
MNESFAYESAPIINFEKSIKTNRLVFKLTFGTIFDYFLSYFSSIFLIVLAGLFIPMMINGLKNEFALTLAIICCVIVIVWMIANLILMNNLVVIDGSNLISNKKRILKSLDALFDDIDSSKIDENVIRNIRLSTSIRWGRAITVLFNEEKIYLNILTLGRGDGPSPFHGLSNYIKCKRIAAIFNQMV